MRNKLPAKIQALILLLVLFNGCAVRHDAAYEPVLMDGHLAAGGYIPAPETEIASLDNEGRVILKRARLRAGNRTLWFAVGMWQAAARDYGLVLDLENRWDKPLQFRLGGIVVSDLKGQWSSDLTGGQREWTLAPGETTFIFPYKPARRFGGYLKPKTRLSEIYTRTVTVPRGRKQLQIIFKYALVSPAGKGSEYEKRLLLRRDTSFFPFLMFGEHFHVE